MKGAKNLLKESIATKMLLVVLAVYLVIALLVSASHIWMNYNYQKKNITQELQNIEKAFAYAIAVNLWGLDEEALHATVDGMLLIPTLVGVNINTEKGSTVAIAGIVNKNGESGDVGLHVRLAGLNLSEIKIPLNEQYRYGLFSRQFPIEYDIKGERIPLGQATIYSNSSVVYKRMKLQGFMLAFDIALTLLTFTIALLWVFNRYLRGPLASLASSAEKVSMENLDSFRVKTELTGPNELTSLEQSLNTMIDNLNKSKVEREQAEEKLRKKQYILSKAQEIGKIGSWELDIEENMLLWTDENYKIFGIPVGTKLTYQTFLDRVHPEDRDYVDKSWKASLKKTPYDIEHRILVDGNVKWVREKAELYFDETDECIGGIGLTQDITTLKQAEKELRDSHERFLTVVDAIDATVYVADFNTHEILFMNKYMIDSFGRDMTGEICWKAFRGESRQCSHCSNDKLIDKNNIPTGPITWNDKNPITGKYYINHERAIRWTDGRLVKLQIATDITDLLNMERQLLQAQKMEAIGVLAGGIAHDFNNILGAILGYAEMVQDDCPPGSRSSSDIDKVVEASYRAKELVKQILAFSRQGESEERVLQPALIIKEAIKMLRASLPTTIDIQQNIDREAGLILADPTQIHQIITNLCTNAFHAMEETGGTLNISLKNKELALADLVNEPDVQPGLFAEISVGDTGPGIAPEDMDKIFDPFFTTKQVGKGTGMGLAIIHGIAKKSGGIVSCKSSPGEGAAFNVYFPVHASTAQPEGEITPIEVIEHGIESILFIDDEVMLAEMGKTMLERLGYRVTIETNSIEALKIIQSQPDRFDLVITDQTMPGMTGSDLARRILQIRQGLPIILCTGFSNLISEEKARIFGIKGFAMKPLAKKDLASLIRKVLDEE